MLTGWKHYAMLGVIAIVAYTIVNRVSSLSKLVNNGIDNSTGSGT